MAGKAAAVLLALVATANGAPDAHAATTSHPGLRLNCTVTGGSSVALTLPPVLVATPDSVPEDGAALVSVTLPVPALPGSGLKFVGAEVVFPIPEEVADIDLTFAGGTVPALDWDARGGTRVAVHFRPPTPLPYENAALPVTTVVNTFDPGSHGRKVAWPVFRSLSLFLEDANGARTAVCTPTDTALALASTVITAPTAVHERPIPARDAVIRATAENAPPAPPTTAAGASPGVGVGVTSAGEGSPGAPGAEVPGGVAAGSTPSSTVEESGSALPAAGSGAESGDVAAPTTAGTAASSEEAVWRWPVALAAVLVLALLGAVVLWMARADQQPARSRNLRRQRVSR